MKLQSNCFYGKRENVLMSEKKEHYVYLGYYMNLKIFYNTKDQNIYPDVNSDASAIPVTLFT